MSGWCYMLRCSDDSYYVGSTSYEDVDTRVSEHNEGRFPGYTHDRRPVTLVWAEQFGDLLEAQVMERQIKGWRREKKEALAQQDWKALSYLAKRPGARRPSRAATRPPQGDAFDLNSHPEARAAQPRASKDDGPESAT